MKRKRYILDLTNCKDCKLFKIKGMPKKIPLVTGSFIYDYDLVEEELPKELIAKWREKAEKQHLNKFGRIRNARHRPMGTNACEFPEGAKLIEVKE